MRSSSSRASADAASRVSSSCSRRAACSSRQARAARRRVEPRERIEHVALVGRPRETALLELAAHRDQRLRGGRDVLARRAPPPGVRPGAAVGEDPPREHDVVLAFRPQLGERAERLVVDAVELGLDVRLVPGGADQRRIALRAEQETDRVREDRLPAPVSPVIAFSPRPSSSSASRIRTRFEMRRRRSTLHGTARTAGGGTAKAEGRAYREKNVASGSVASRLGCAPTRTIACVAVRKRADLLPVDEDGRLRRPCREVRDHDVGPARHDERPDVDRVRRDERQHHRVEAPDEHRAAVRQVVGGRAGRRRADQPVARLRAEVLAADA